MKRRHIIFSVAALTGVLFPVAAQYRHRTRLNADGRGPSGVYVTPPPSGALPTFTLTAASTQAAAPFTLGHAFRQGDVPAGAGLVVGGATAQVNIKNAWPDGSAKFGIISGVASLSAGTPATLTLSNGAASAGTALTTADLRAAAPVASIGCGSFGTVTFSGSDWASPNRVWISGHAMSSWTYRKPVGGDPHLVAWLEVRLYAGGAVEVFPWLENGYIAGGVHANKSATYTFTLGGTQRFSASIDLKHHLRTPLISGTMLTYFAGSDPGVTPKHDTAYFQATELVPSYRSVPTDAYVNARQAAESWTPLQQGDYQFGQSATGNGGTDSMRDSGYGRPLGLLPEWDVLYLTSQNPLAYQIAIRNAMSAGRYPIHYRDSATQRPPRFSAFPTTVIGDGQGFVNNGASTTNSYAATGTGGILANYDRAHSPSMGYMAYLLTGRLYFMEQVQFQATANYLGITDWVRGGGGKGMGPDYAPAHGYISADYICHGGQADEQTRAIAWDFRTVVLALTATPDTGDALRAELVNTVQKTIKYVHALYVAQPNNPYGVTWPGDWYREDLGLRVFAPWQQNFYTAAWGYALALDLPIDLPSRTRLRAFFAWKAKSVTTLLGTTSGFRFEDAGRYNLLISPAANMNFRTGAGPWYATDAELYAANAAVLPSSSTAKTPNTLWSWDAGPNEAQGMAQGKWGELQMAIAYAVRHGAPGAVAGYNRMIGATNWGEVARFWNTNFPVMGVKPYAPPVVTSPSTGALRTELAWLAGKPLNEWFPIPNTAGAQGAAVDIWGGFAVNDATSELWVLASGGHNDSADNRVVSLLLSADAPTWVLRHAPSTAWQRDVTHYADGKPGSRHIYHHNWYLPGIGPTMVGGRALYGSGGTDSRYLDVFDETTNQWKPRDTLARLPAGGFPNFQDKLNGKIWTNGLIRYNPLTNAWESGGTSGGGGGRWPAAHDTRRNQAYYLMWGDGQGYNTELGASSQKMTLGATNIVSIVTINPSAAFSQWRAISGHASHAYTAMDYDTANDRFCYYNGTTGGVVYVIQPNSGNAWDMSILPLGSGSARVPNTIDAGINSRFKYIPALKGFVCMPVGSSNVYFLRTA